ncbi:MAG: hypothetical protein ACTSVI_08155 [Promethearchaeota archaeon]
MISEINWFIILDKDAPDLIWNMMEIGIFIIFCIFGAYFFFLHLKKRRENQIQANFNIGYSMFFIIQCLNQGMYIGLSIEDNGIFFTPEVHDYLSSEVPIFLFGSSDPLFNYDIQIYYMLFFFLLAFWFILFPTEKYLRNSKKFPVSTLLLIGSFFLAFTIIVGHFIWGNMSSLDPGLMNFLGIIEPIGVIIVVIAFVIGMFFSVFFYILLAVKTTGELRKKSALTALGFIVWFLSVIIGNGLKTDLVGFLILVGPALFYTGTIMLYFSFLKK